MEKKKIRFAAWNIQDPKVGTMPEGSVDPHSVQRVQTLLDHEKPDFAFLQEMPPLHCLNNHERSHFSDQISSRGKDYCSGIMFYQADLSYHCEIQAGPKEFPVAVGFIISEEKITFPFWLNSVSETVI